MGGVSTAQDVAIETMANASHQPPNPSIQNVVQEPLQYPATQPDKLKSDTTRSPVVRRKKARKLASLTENKPDETQTSCVPVQVRVPPPSAETKNEYETLKKSALNMFAEVTNSGKKRKHCKRKKKVGSAERRTTESRRFQYLPRKGASGKHELKEKRDDSWCSDKSGIEGASEALENSHSSTEDNSVDSGKDSSPAAEVISKLETKGENGEAAKKETTVEKSVKNEENSEVQGIEDNDYLPNEDEVELKLIKPCYARPTQQGFFENLNHEICMEITECDVYMNNMMPFCSKLREIIESLAIRAFGRIQCSAEITVEMYGSMATRLALPASDLDIIVCGLAIYSREDAMDAVNLFTKDLENAACVVQCTAIATAKVPVIKLV